MDANGDAWLQTFSGGRIYPLDPSPDQIDIEDIAHSLSMQIRFAGHIKRFWSVASHSIMVSQIVPAEHALQGLLHDASEAYLVDCPTPLKRTSMFAEYRAAEKRLQEMIYAKFGCNTVEHPSVKEADKIMLATEATQLLGPLHPEWKLPAGVEPLGWRLEPLPPHEAERQFLARFRELGGK
jgi:5'-deoxynucleotidase YfbR-like HD superfamily hydrolase